MAQLSELNNSELFDLYLDARDHQDDWDNEGLQLTEENLENIRQEIRLRGYEDPKAFARYSSSLYYGNYATVEEYTASLNA